jgi:pimeloyl-ACP methyl ester carboxylesterase
MKFKRTLDELELPVFAINGDYPQRPKGALLTGVDAERMPGVRHFPHLEDPKEFNRILRAVIKRVADRSLRGRTEM